MLDENEKEGAIDYNRPVIKELFSLLSTCKDFQTKETILKLVPLIKRAFRGIFFISCSYTFEELIFKIKNFDKECEKIFKRIEDLDKKKEDFILRGKGNKKDKFFFPQLKNIGKEIELENDRYNSCRAISKILEDTKIKDKIINFCSYLPILVFSGQKISGDELKKIIFDFLWIVNRMGYFHTNKKNGGVFEKIIYEINKIKPLGEKGNEVQIDEIRRLISKAETAFKDNDFFTAGDIYRNILNMYGQAHYDLRESAYEDIFNLWFRLYSHS